VVADEVVAALGDRKLVRDPAPVWSRANLSRANEMVELKSKGRDMTGA